MYVACLVGAFVLYIGIAMWFTFRARDAEQRQIRYQVFRDLRDLFFRREAPEAQMSAVIPALVPRRRGRPPCCSPELAIRIIRLRRQGLSYAAISGHLERGRYTDSGRGSCGVGTTSSGYSIPGTFRDLAEELR